MVLENEGGEQDRGFFPYAGQQLLVGLESLVGGAVTHAQFLVIAQIFLGLGKACSSSGVPLGVDEVLDILSADGAGQIVLNDMQVPVCKMGISL